MAQLVLRVSIEPSHVLMAMGLSHDIAHGSIRFTLGKKNTKADVEYLMEFLPEIIERLRSMSPLYECVRKERV